MKLFGTDGIRDAFGGKKMNPEIAAALGRAIVSFCRKRNLPEKIIVGRDPRESGPFLEEAVVSGIISMGGGAIVAGILPTPALAYLVSEQKAGAGIVISASHNPWEDNGLKPFKSDGTKLSEEEEKEIEEYIFKKISSGGNENASGKKSVLPDGKEKYIKFLLEKFSSDFRSDNLKIVLDLANGATFEAAPAVFKNVAGEIKYIHADPNGRNINQNCGSQHPQNLRERVLEEKADLGLAFDGDGDRVIAVDEKGRALTGDQMIYVIAKFLKEKGKLKKNLVVTTVMSNLGFVDALKKLGIDHIAAAVGDRQVFFEMKRKDAVLGGEESGHIIYSDFYPTGDGITGGLMLLAAMDHFKKPLSELAGEITLFPKLLVNVFVKSKPELDTIPEIQAIIKEVENELGSEGRVLVRYSGTENLCRVMVEGREETEIAKYAEEIAEVIRKNLN
ncbi:MAG: phosphoglucosamine mutase [Candidatus Moranbacteria bacterium]|nr:phosphoglucosamine mutase [Candidatus Moranbacteria bacterium]